MDQQSKFQTVVQGEASESDEDEEVENIMSSKHVRGVVVSGEASESEEEETDNEFTNHQDLVPLNVDTSKSGDSLHGPITPKTRLIEKEELKYDTLLHKKLRERNVSLRRSLVDTVHQVYVGGSKELKNTTLQLVKSQNAIQDVSHNLRLLTNDLFNLEDKIDIVLSCTLLPDINISPEVVTPIGRQ
ncbi:biogenesis of lysosome-related organelles complex 1 subunit 3 [Lingula anatina]|uniref:Biogenesis of lysosome-related organelles complex 1 subunit 3 n=1 Tax=Lingula anatina TaxID=7574 RepID=A0A1S3H3S9_LINAN|nr:biogenesis of lysosome-related organelles complex 1 subunit 3 [Lingula anatina]|eukprot:XP_013379794.1 biogenesis of lysosome-related organelles complex 1 subunit 3 [Lingula anatina]